MLYKGIDVSSWQGNIDWEKVKDNIDFAIIRGGYSTTFDSKAEYNLKMCNKLNIPCGVYWFSYAINKMDSFDEAETCLSLIKNYKLHYPVYFDFEDASTNYIKKAGVEVTKEIVSAITESFCKCIESNGYFVGIYSNENYLKNYFSTELLQKYALWYAYWKESKNRNVPMWQYSSEGKINGIVGNVDLNISYVDYPAIIQKNGLNHLNKVSVKDIRDKLNEIYSLLDRGEKNGFE